MKKFSVILIGFIYIASIVVISVFGLRAESYTIVVPVTKIECTNETDSNTEVSINNAGKKVIKVKYGEPGNPETLSGTMIQLTYKVYPDDATNKDVKFVYNKNNTNAVFHTTEDGKETGLIFFKGKCYMEITITATDGSNCSTTIIVWAY